jgi:LuxR family maltose regulon positive regulatory protein
MSAPILATKLYIPLPRSKIVQRTRLVERLNEGLAAGCRLTLVSAPAGFGKTTLVSEWISSCGRPVAWLSLDEGDNDPARFISYLVKALQTIQAGIGEGLLAALQSPQPLQIETILTSLLNEISAIPENPSTGSGQDFLLILDDYHSIDSQPVDQCLAFIIEHQPPHMHLLIATREDPHLPVSRLRGRGQCNELRASDLRFTPAEAAEFLNQVMGLNLSAEDIAALDMRTEGWIAGLQLAALSMQTHKDTAGFIQSFTGSHRFVMDYLLEEVLHQQSESIQTFLLRTSVLERMCGPLCDAVLQDTSIPGQATLEYLEHANLFIVPLDDERRWYRYHHLFGDLLRKRLGQSLSLGGIAELHIHASVWYEDNDLMIEAFQHATAANDIERAERLMAEGRLPLHFRDMATTTVNWLEALPRSVLDARPWLWVRSATSALMAGQVTGVEEKLQAADAAVAATLHGAEPDEKTRDLIGQIAAVRATLAHVRYQPETSIIQAGRALEYLHSDNLPFRSRATWSLAFAYMLQGKRAAARQAYTEAIRQASGNIYYTILTSTGLGQLQESENQLYQAAETYRNSIQLLSDKGTQNASEEFIGLARIYYEWNELDAAEQHAQQSLQWARLYDRTLDRFIICEVFLARLKLARGDVFEAATMLAETEQSVRQNNFVQRVAELVSTQVLTLLRQGNVAAASHLVQTHHLPLSQARVLLAQGNPSAALAVLQPFRQQMEAREWQDELLRGMVLQSVALHAQGEKDQAVQVLSEALTVAEPEGFIRLFVDEGPLMAQLLHEAASRCVMPDYVSKLLAAFEAKKRDGEGKPGLPPGGALVEPLSPRELKILQLIALGLSNREIGERLFLAVDTIKGHNRILFDKLEVQSRTEAVARAHELGLI